MPRKALPRDSRIARHCTQGNFVDPQTMLELSKSAFAPTEDDPEPSVNWLEYYELSDDERIAAVCRDMNSQRAVRTRHKLAILGVQQAVSIGSEEGRSIDVLHDQLPKNESHSVIVGLQTTDDIIHQELADAASQRLVNVVVPAKTGS